MFPYSSFDGITGAERPEPERKMDTNKEEKVQQLDGSGLNISARTFTFRELAAATRNFRQECLLGEGGFGWVYRGHLESTGQVKFSIKIF